MCPTFLLSNGSMWSACFRQGLWVSNLFQFTKWKVSEVKASEVAYKLTGTCNQGHTSEPEDVFESWLIVVFPHFHWAMPGAYRMWLMFLGTLGTTGRVAAACCKFNAWSCCFHVLWGCALAVLSSPRPLFAGGLLVLSPELGSEQCTPQSPKAEALLCS